MLRKPVLKNLLQFLPEFLLCVLLFVLRNLSCLFLDLCPGGWIFHELARPGLVTSCARKDFWVKLLAEAPLSLLPPLLEGK